LRGCAGFKIYLSLAYTTTRGMANELVRFDWAMKRLLRQKSNFVILEGLISELLKEDIKIQQILESESNC
jgi:hypothetical protein